MIATPNANSEQSSIELYTGDANARANTWANLSPSDLRRRAMVPANNRDAAELWSLTEAHLVLYGKAGVKAAAATIRAYRRGVYDLIEAWRGENLLRPRRDAGWQWVRSLEAAGKSPATVGVRLAAARALYSALHWAGATDVAPFLKVKPGRDSTPAWEKRHPYSEDELEKLMAEAGTADRVMILLGCHGGLRVSEMASLRWQDVDLSGGSLLVRDGKGGKARTVVMSTTLRATMAALPRSGEDVLGFGDGRARQRMRRLCRSVGVAYKGVHALRHSCGTRCYRETRDLRVAAEHLGHSSIDTTRVYAKWDRETLRASVGAW